MGKTAIIHDSLFKRIFGGSNKASRRSVRHLLKTFLDMEIQSIEQLSSNVTTGLDNKQMIADVLLLVNHKHFVIIEMQNQRKGDDPARFTSYESLITMVREDKGIPYDEAKNIILVFVGYYARKDKLVDESNICHRYSDGYLYSDKYIIKIVELVGLSKLAKQPVETMTSKERYKLFLRYMNAEQYPQYKGLIKQIIENEEELKMTLTDIIRTTNKKDLAHELLRWKNEEQILREQAWEEQRERELIEAKEKIKAEAERVKIESEKAKLEANKAKIFKEENERLQSIMEIMKLGKTYDEAVKEV